MNGSPVCASHLRGTEACSLRIISILPRRTHQLSRVSPFPGVKLRIGWRNGPRRNPQNGVEGIHWVETAVKPKYELVEVSLQMMRLNPAVMGAIDPRLQIGEDKVNHRQVLFRFFRVASEREGIVPIAH